VSSSGRLRRRAISVSVAFGVAVGSVLFLPLWLPATLIADVVTLRRRLPLTRLALCGVCWAWLESAGILAATWLWLTFRSGDRRAHVVLQRWWIHRLVGALQRCADMPIEAPDVSAFGRGPLILMCRHASYADSLVSAWVTSVLAGMDPRYVLKRELLADPCLDIVGNRLPNHFLDRGATDSGPELAALRSMAATMGSNDVAIIFPEGTRAAPHKRERMLSALADKDPLRTSRLSGLRHLLPPRPAGAVALLEGCPTADVVVGWHTGFEGMDTVRGIYRRLAKGATHVHFEARRIDRADVPEGGGFTAWLDAQWLELDEKVHAQLSAGAVA
jgi:1-acyl-sn-glycerol-3-phosphate acyltransferase